MARQGLVARPAKRRRRCLTRPDMASPPVPDLVKRDFTAAAVDCKWCGDLTEVPTDGGKLYAELGDARLEFRGRRRRIAAALEPRARRLAPRPAHRQPADRPREGDGIVRELLAKATPRMKMTDR